MWNAAGVATTQIFQMDKSYGADGIVARNDIKTVKDLKGKRVAAWLVPGTAPYFFMSWVLLKNGNDDERRQRRAPRSAERHLNAFIAGTEYRGRGDLRA